jgi:hypothetical protein
MRLSLPPPTPGELRRLEAAAASRPGLYAARLVLFALAGDVLMTTVRVAPLAVPVVFGALIYNNIYIDGLAAVAVLLFLWLARPRMHSGGGRIARPDAPALFDALDALKSALDVGGRIDVRLDDALSASASEERGLFGVAGTGRVLTLGVPLLALLSRDEVCAVIAHEFGHFSRRHGRFGHWLYWVHLDWLCYAKQTDDDSSILERGAAVFSQIFAPAFSRRALVWSRRCEYEADADAARAAGGVFVVSALMRLAVFEAWFNDAFPRIVRDWERSEPNPPDDFLARMIAAFDGAPPDLLAGMAAGAARRSGDWSDTHPAVMERAAALGVEPDLAPRGAPAGAALLGTLWPDVVAAWNVSWRNDKAVDWAAAHVHYRLIDVPLLAAPPETVAGWPAVQQLARAEALHRWEPTRGLAELDALHAAFPDDRRITYACAAARLAAGDAGAVKTLIALAREDQRWRLKIFPRLVLYCEATGDGAGASRWARGLEMAKEAGRRAWMSMHDDLAAGRLAPTTRAAPVIATVHAALAAEPAIAKAWLLEGKVRLAGTRTARAQVQRADALILAVDPLDARQKPRDIHAMMERQRDVLDGLIEPDALPVVMAHYTTETLQQTQSAALAKVPPGCVYLRGGI